MFRVVACPRIVSLTSKWISIYGTVAEYSVGLMKFIINSNVRDRVSVLLISRS